MSSCLYDISLNKNWLVYSSFVTVYTLIFCSPSPIVMRVVTQLQTVIIQNSQIQNSPKNHESNKEKQFNTKQSGLRLPVGALLAGLRA